MVKRRKRPRSYYKVTATKLGLRRPMSTASGLTRTEATRFKRMWSRTGIKVRVKKIR